MSCNAPICKTASEDLGALLSRRHRRRGSVWPVQLAPAFASAGLYHQLLKLTHITKKRQRIQCIGMKDSAAQAMPQVLLPTRLRVDFLRLEHVAVRPCLAPYVTLQRKSQVLTVFQLQSSQRKAVFENNTNNLKFNFMKNEKF